MMKVVLWYMDTCINFNRLRIGDKPHLTPQQQTAPHLRLL